MIYIGVDPSYTKTGVTYIDLENKHIYFNAISPPGRNDTYGDALIRALYISERIKTIPLKYKTKRKTIIIEEPLITSQMSSRLGILSGVVGSALYMHCLLSSMDMYSLNPNVVSNTNRKLKEYTPRTRKRVSKEIALKYLDVFIEHGFTHTIHNDILNKDGSMKKRQLSQDEAESFIMVIILLLHLNKLPAQIKKDLTNVNRGLVTADYTVNKLQASN